LKILKDLIENKFLSSKRLRMRKDRNKDLLKMTKDALALSLCVNSQHKSDVVNNSKFMLHVIIKTLHKIPRIIGHGSPLCIE
jgi:hypothetical protein